MKNSTSHAARVARTFIVGFGTIALSACANGGLGNVLGSVLGGGMGQGQGQSQTAEVSGYIAGVNQRSQQIGIQQSNGQTIGLSYDNQTQVVYQNRNYPVTALQNGDVVMARVQSGSNGGYYTDLVQVNQSVQDRGGTTQHVQTFQGRVRQIDLNNGWFVLDAGNGSGFPVYMPYQANGNDVARFRGLRQGEYVRFYGTIDANSRVQLRQFY